jgi:hypothetical protein
MPMDATFASPDLRLQRYTSPPLRPCVTDGSRYFQSSPHNPTTCRSLLAADSSRLGSLHHPRSGHCRQGNPPRTSSSFHSVDQRYTHLQPSSPERSPNRHATFPSPRARLQPFCSTSAPVNAFVRASLRRLPPLQLHSPSSAPTRLRSLRKASSYPIRILVNNPKPEAAGVPRLMRTISHYVQHCVVSLADATLARHNGDCDAPAPRPPRATSPRQHAPAFAHAHLASLGGYSFSPGPLPGCPCNRTMPVPVEHRCPLTVVPPIAVSDSPGGPPFE